MNQPNSLLIREGQPIPWEYTPTETLEIPSIDPAQVRHQTTELIDLTTHESTGLFREKMAGPTTLTLADGRRYTASRDLISLALAGGGRFVAAYLNAPCWVQTEAEYEAELEADAERDAYDYWD